MHQTGIADTLLHRAAPVQIPRYHIADALMRPLTVVEADVLVENALQPVQPKQDQMVQTLATYCPYPVGSKNSSVLD